jgi:hypothetical protein
MAFYCSWLPLFALGFAVRRRNGMLALATVPLFAYLLILIAGPVPGMRYMVPMILGSVLVAGLTMVPACWQSASEYRDRNSPRQVTLVDQSGLQRRQRQRVAGIGDSALGGAAPTTAGTGANGSGWIPTRDQSGPDPAARDSVVVE